jgi:hypothetical protein
MLYRSVVVLHESPNLQLALGRKPVPRLFDRLRSSSLSGRRIIALPHGAPAPQVCYILPDE